MPISALEVKDSVTSFSGYLLKGFKYNLQVFPDTLMAATFLFAVLFQSPSLATLGSSFLALNLIHPLIAGFLTRVVSGIMGPDVDPGLCSGRFPGVSYERLLDMSSERTFGALNREGWPSYYSMFIGFLGGWVGSLPFIYNKEISANGRNTAAATASAILLSLVVAMGIVYRTLISRCDTAFGTFVGVGVGAVLGAMIVGFLAWVSDRRLTNILNFPLIRNRAADGKPIYVCEGKQMLKTRK